METWNRMKVTRGEGGGKGREKGKVPDKEHV